VREEFEAFLRCGVLDHGFLRVVCEHCHAERLLAFSCKKRGFCPSCGARRMAESARHLVEEVFGPRPVRQWVLSIPVPLRLLFASKPEAAFLAEGQFPEGSVHLRESTSMGNVIPADGESQAHKLETMRMLMADFPDRKFLLIGDSGELDPEIYGTIAREFPRRIVAIRIRDVTGDPRASERYERAFADVAPALWSLFSDTPRWQPFLPPNGPDQVVGVPAQPPAPDCLAP